MTGKAVQRINLAVADENLARIKAAGGKVDCIDRRSHHYRITGPAGGSIDFWASALRWRETRGRAPLRRGRGVDTLLEALPLVTGKAKASKPKKARKTYSPKPTVMIFADASYCASTRAAGWGAWIKADGKPSITVGGAIQAAATSAADAEAYALANAVTAAKVAGYIGAGAAVMLQTDCLVVLMGVRRAIPTAFDSPAAGGSATGRRRAAGTDGFQKAMAVLAKDLRGAVVITRHVKGHQAGGGRNWVNRTCDEIARKGMERRRDLAREAAPAAEVEARA